MFIPDLNKIQRQYPISCSRFTEFVDIALAAIGLDSTFRQHHQFVIFNEVIAIFNSNTQNDYYPETADWINMAESMRLPFAHYRLFKNKITTLFKKEILDISRIEDLWKEHANTYLTYYFNDTKDMIWIVFHPVQSCRQLETILRQEIDAALERNEFVPYKYLRLIGRL